MEVKSLEERILELKSIGGIDSKFVRETKYSDGVMKVFEQRNLCSTPVKKEDILVEYVFVFEKF